MSTSSTSSQSTSATSFVAASAYALTSTPPTSTSTSAPDNVVGIAADQGNHTLKVSDPHLSTTTMVDLPTNTPIDAHDGFASTGLIYPWQIGQMPSFHRRSSCATLETLSAPLRHPGHGVFGDAVNNGNPMHFSLCSTSWQASQWEHSGGLPPPRPVSAPALSTSLLAESNALDSGPSWLNPILTSDAQYSNGHGYDQTARIEELSHAADPDLSMPPMTTSIPAVSTIPVFPGLTSGTTSFVDNNTGIASWLGSGSWSWENSGGVTAVPLGSEDMQIDDLMFQPHRLLGSETAGVPGDSFTDLEPPSKSTLGHADDWTSQSDDMGWNFSAFVGGTGVNCSVPFPQPGSTHPSSVPSSSWSTQPSSIASSPEAFPATAAVCSLPSTQSSNLVSSHYIDGGPGRGNQAAYSPLPSPALLTDYLNHSRMTSVEQPAESISGALKSGEPPRDLGHSNGPGPTSQAKDHHPVTPNKRPVKLEMHSTSDTSPQKSAVSTIQGGNRTNAIDASAVSTLTPAVHGFRVSSIRSCGQSQDRPYVTSVTGTAQSYTSAPDRYTLQEPQCHSTSANGGIFENRFVGQVRYEDIVNMSPQDRPISRQLGQFHPYSSSRPMSSGHMADRRPPYITPRPTRSHAGSVTSSAMPNVAHCQNGAGPTPGLIQPTAQRRAAHFNVMAEMSPLSNPSSALGLTSTPRSASARLESQVDGPLQSQSQAQEGAGSLRSVALSRKQAPPSPPFRPMYGQDVPCTTMKDRPKSGKNGHPGMESQLGGMDKTPHQKAESVRPSHGMAAATDTRNSLMGNNSLGLVLKNPLVGTNILDLISKTEVSSVHRVQKRAIVACTPCRTTKRKCDGGQPCSACRRRKYPRGGPCEYITPTQRPRASGGKATAAASKKAAAQAAALAAAAARQSNTSGTSSQVTASNGNGTLSRESASGPMAGCGVVRTTPRHTKYSTQQHPPPTGAAAATMPVRHGGSGRGTENACSVEAVSTSAIPSGQCAAGLIGKTYVGYESQRGPAPGLDVFAGVKMDHKARPGVSCPNDEVKALDAANCQ